MFLNHIVLTAWRVLLGTPQPEADRDARNYSRPRLGDRENVDGPVARFERGMQTFVVMAARAASGV